MATLVLKNGSRIIVDEDDVVRLRDSGIYERTGNGAGYIRVSHTVSGQKRDRSAGAFLLNMPLDTHTHRIGHKNKNPYDLRKENLEIIPSAGTQRKRRQRTVSGYKGVSWSKRIQQWVVFISVDSKQVYLGSFFDVIEAARAYNNAAIKHFGKKAIDLNDV